MTDVLHYLNINGFDLVYNELPYTIENASHMFSDSYVRYANDAFF